MWDELVLNPMINLLLLFYNLMGQQTILAIAALTLLVRLSVLPLTLKQQQSSQRMQELQPELKKLQQKYAKDKEKLSQEQMKLYQEAGINPLGGCLPLLVQLPILIGLYQSIIRVLAVTPLDLVKLSQNVGRAFFIKINVPVLTSLIPLQSHFLWLDLGRPDPYFILPVLVVITSWLSQKVVTPPPTDERTAATTQQMQVMMPLMFGFISISYASGLSIYFIISNIVSLLQFLVIRRGRSEDQGKWKEWITKLWARFSRAEK